VRVGLVAPAPLPLAQADLHLPKDPAARATAVAG
jgi:hypothetical protein